MTEKNAFHIHTMHMRLDCLRLAVDLAKNDKDATCNDILAAARTFIKFVLADAA